MSELFSTYQSLASASLDDALSLPFGVYHDPKVYQHEVEHIFHHEWVFVCAEKELAKEGDYLALDLAGESIVVIRGKDKILRALSNHCRHRGTQLLDYGFGNVSGTITCPYHAWSYGTDGTFFAAPFTGSIEVDQSVHCLLDFNLDIYMGLVFVSLSNKPKPLSERFDRVQEFASVFEPSRFDVAIPSTEEIWQANWKLAMENAMESYHLFKVHKKTLEQVSPTREAYYVAGSAEWTLTGGKMTDTSGALTRWFRGDHPQAYNHYLLFSLPPNFVGVMTYDSFGWISILPTSSEQCQIRAGAVIQGGYGSGDKESQDFTAAFFAEDKWICERVQKSMYSKQGKGGKLIEMERVVVDFHQFLASRLFGSECDGFYHNSAPGIPF